MTVAASYGQKYRYAVGEKKNAAIYSTHLDHAVNGVSSSSSDTHNLHTPREGRREGRGEGDTAERGIGQSKHQWHQRARYRSVKRKSR